MQRPKSQTLVAIISLSALLLASVHVVSHEGFEFGTDTARDVVHGKAGTCGDEADLSDECLQCPLCQNAGSTRPNASSASAHFVLLEDVRSKVFDFHAWPGSQKIGLQSHAPRAPPTSL